MLIINQAEYAQNQQLKRMYWHVIKELHARSFIGFLHHGQKKVLFV